MVMLDASRRNQRVPRLARWSLGAGIVATVGASLAHGLGHGPIGALVSAWPALALVGSPELLMLLVRTASQTVAATSADRLVTANVPEEPTINEMVRAIYQEGTGQRAIRGS